MINMINMRKIRKKIAPVSVIACAVLLVAALAVPADAAIERHEVDAAWKRIAAAAGMEPIPIVYEAEKAPNAWVKFESSKKFSVHVTQGLMQLLTSPDEIAGILGHEMGHIKLGHYNKGVRRNVGWAILGAALGRAGGVAEVAGAVGMNLAESGFSREQEVEADDYGSDLAIKAGYSPWGLYNAMKKFRDNGFKLEPSGFNSHPPTDRRLQRLEERAKRASGR